MVDFEMSKDKVMMGVERRSMILSDEEKKNTAYHEAGHALVAGDDAGRRSGPQVTDHPRGMALGLTMQLPEDDKHTYTREYLEAMLAVLMGGRSGGGNFSRPHHHRRRQRYRTRHGHRAQYGLRMGMSELGPLAYGKKDGLSSWAAKSLSTAIIPKDTAIQIDKK